MKCPKCGSEIPMGDCTTCKHSKDLKNGAEFTYRPSCFKHRKLNLVTCYEPRGHESKVGEKK